MSHKRRHLPISIDLLRVSILRARAAHESRQQVLHDTRIQVNKLQHQLLELQQQLNTLNNQRDIAHRDRAVNPHTH